MTNILNTSIYSKIEPNGVWARENFESISYSDGDLEESDIYSIVSNASDLSVFSAELRSECNNWVRTYHLSPLRTNLLRPISALFGAGKTVLEIGAGCGAITRFIGETGAQVVALEGSKRRATIAKLRARDLPNVNVVSERFDNFKCEHKFDVVTFIGVLEYANLFSNGEDAALNTLNLARSYLKDSGHIVIAIENQFGLKYFAGAPEDHLGIPMYGIEGRYKSTQVETFGKKVLINKLQSAGFNFVETLAPFPDYKIPISIITENGAFYPAFDAATLASQSVPKDPQIPSDTFFNLERTWRGIFNNGLALDLANSFLMIGSSSSDKIVPKELLAIHYSTDRQPAFCKETLFVKSKNNKVLVKYNKLSEKVREKFTDTINIHFRLPKSAEYILGEPLSKKFVDIVTAQDWTMSEVEVFFQYYLDTLQSILRSEGYELKYDSDYMLPGDYLDAIPSNIILNLEGATYIDREWSSTNGVSFDYLVFRAISSLLEQVNHIAKSKHVSNNRGEFFTYLMKSVGLNPSELDFKRFLKFESELSVLSSGLRNRVFSSWSPESSLYEAGSALIIEVENSLKAAEKLSLERLDEIHRQNEQLKEYEKALAEVTSLSLQRLAETQYLSERLAETESSLEQVRQQSVERLEGILTLDQRLQETDNALQIATAQSVERLAQIELLDQRLLETDNALQIATAQSVERLAQIELLDQRLRETDNALQITAVQSMERLAQIEILDKRLLETDSALELASSQSAERLNQIEVLDKHLRETDIALQMTSKLSSERLTQIHELDKRLIETDNSLQVISRQSIDRLKQIELLDQRLIALNCALEFSTALSNQRLKEIELLGQRLIDTDEALATASNQAIERLAHIQVLDSQLLETQNALDRVSEQSVKRLEEIQLLDERLKQTTKALNTASSLSEERLYLFTNADAQLRQTQIALDNVTSLSIERLNKIIELDSQLKQAYLALERVTMESMERLMVIQELNKTSDVISDSVNNI